MSGRMNWRMIINNSLNHPTIRRFWGNVLLTSSYSPSFMGIGQLLWGLAHNIWLAKIVFQTLWLFNIANWKITLFCSKSINIYKSSINGPFSIAMLNNQRTLLNLGSMLNLGGVSPVDLFHAQYFSIQEVSQRQADPWERFSTWEGSRKETVKLGQRFVYLNYPLGYQWFVFVPSIIHIESYQYIS